MTKRYKTAIEIVRPILDSLNAQYGKGNVGEIRLSLDGNGTFEQLPYGMKPQKRKFRIEIPPSFGNKVRVYALGHQKTIMESNDRYDSFIKDAIKNTNELNNN